MSISPVSNSYPILQQSSKMAEEAASEINQIQQFDSLKIDGLEFNKVDLDKEPDKVSQTSPPSSYADPLIKLNQSQQYNRIGTNMLQRDQDMIGTMLDLHV